MVLRLYNFQSLTPATLIQPTTLIRETRVSNQSKPSLEIQHNNEGKSFDPFPCETEEAYGKAALGR